MIRPAFGSVTLEEKAAVAAVTSGIFSVPTKIMPPFVMSENEFRKLNWYTTYPDFSLRESLQRKFGYDSLSGIE